MDIRDWSIQQKIFSSGGYGQSQKYWSFLKKFETRVGQLAKHLSNLPSNIFRTNMKNNSKNHCSDILVDERIIVKAIEKWADGPVEEELQDGTYKDNKQDPPKKEVDSGVVVLHVSIGNMKVKNSLIDLGANVDIIPLSVVEGIRYLQIESSTSKLQMTDKTCRTPVVFVKDVLIQIDKFSFLVDFLILDIKPDPNVSLIYSRKLRGCSWILTKVK